MVKIHKPSVLALLETRMSDHKAIAETLVFNSQIQFPTIGNSRGIVIIWDNLNLGIQNIVILPQGIHVAVKVNNPPSSYFFSATYDSIAMRSERRFRIT